MKYYAYIPDKNGKWSVGSTGKLLFELKTDKGAIRRANRILGLNCIVERYTNFYDDSTFKRISA